MILNNFIWTFKVVRGSGVLLFLVWLTIVMGWLATKIRMTR